MSNKYFVEFRYSLDRFGDIDFETNADDPDQVENEAMAYIKEVFPDAQNISVESIQASNL